MQDGWHHIDGNSVARGASDIRARALAQIRQSAYRNRPGELAKIEAEEQDRAQKKRAKREAAEARAKRIRENFVAGEKHHDRAKTVLPEELLLDQAVVMALVMNGETPIERWPYFGNGALADSEFTTASAQVYVRRLSKYGVSGTVQKLNELVKAECRDRLAKQDGRATTPEELAEKFLAREGRAIMSREEEKRIDEIVMQLYRVNGEMPSPKTLKREREIVYSDVLDLHGGSYRKAKQYYDELYHNGGLPGDELAEEVETVEPEVATEAVIESLIDREENGSIDPEALAEVAIVDEVKEDEEMNENREEVVETEVAEVVEEVKPKKAKIARGRTKRSLTKEMVIENLNKYYARFHDLPTKTKLDELRKAEPEEKWLSYNSFYRHLGKGTEWEQYLVEPEDVLTDDQVTAMMKYLSDETPEGGAEDEDAVEAEVDSETEIEPNEPNEVSEEMFEIEPEVVKVDEAVEEGIVIKLKLSLKAPGMKEPFEVDLNLSSSQK